MQGNKRQRVVLGALLAVLVAVTVWQLQPSGSSPAPANGRAKAGPVPRRGQDTAPVDPVDVTLERLEASGPQPDEGGRSPFRFGAAAPVAPDPDEKSPSARPTGPGTPGPVMPVVPTGPPPPPPAPPIPFKFIGIVSSASTGGKVAVLSDGKFVYHGREGDIIDGRFRVVHIGEESIQMEYFDGRGRQTIRLTGS